MMELPPRARRIPPDEKERIAYQGTTSACAENTVTGWCDVFHGGNYLRVRGEYVWSQHGLIKPRELPPRARRILS